MSSKEEVLKMLDNLSLNELLEAKDYIDNLIARLQVFGTESKRETNDMVNNLHNPLRQERFYGIFTCKFKKTSDLERPPSLGIVVDISKGGLRLKTNKKIKTGDVLVVFPNKIQEAENFAVSAAYDSLHKKTFVEVIRVKEFMGLYEIGCRFLPLNSQLHNFIV